jgi:hypothetical protein
MSKEDERWRDLGGVVDADIARATRWIQQRSTKSRSPVISQHAPPVTAPWLGLAQSAASYAAESAGVPGAEAGMQLLRALCGVEDAQKAMLDSIGRDVSLLREGPFRSAQEQVAIATRRGVDDPQNDHHLQSAEDHLISALGQSSCTEESSVIKFWLGLVALRRDDRKEAQYRLADSYTDCVTVVQEFTSNASDVKVLKTRWSTGLSAYLVYPGVYVAAKKIKKIWRAQEASTALANYIPFVNAVAQTANASGGEGTRPELLLHDKPEKGYELEWVQAQV